nr:hypothetical protein [Tanacetum cinerariifolium]
MDTIIEQQAAMDEALVPHSQRLRIADVPEIYIQELWATATVHHHAIRFKTDNKKHIMNLESFRDMLHICLRVHGQTFDEPPFEEEILAFSCFLGHSAAIRMLTDEDFVYQVKHKNTKKSNEMYYPRFIKVIIYHFMSKDLSILRRNKVNWHYVRDDHMFSTIKLVSRYQNTQQFGALLPIELTNEEIRNSNAYKEYYAVATGAAPPKPKASVRRTRSSSDTSITPLTIVADKGTGSIPGVLNVPTDELEEELFWNSTDDEGADDKGKDGDDDEEDEGDDGEEGDDEGNGDEDLGLNVDGEKGHSEESDHLRDEAQKENDEFLESIDENMKKIIKEQVKDHVKVQVFKILPRIEKAVNEQLEAEVLTRSSHSSKTSYAVVADLSEMELKKILIEKIEGNKSIQCSNKQRNLYKALVKAYESDKIILDIYRETVTLKRRRDNDADKDEAPSAGPDRGSKRHREGKEPESASAPSKTATRSAGMSTKRSIQPWISELAKQADSHSSFNELMDTPLDFFNFLINRLKVDTLTPELLAGPTYELMKGSCKSLVELEYHLEEVFKAITDQLDWVNPEGYDKHALWGVSHWGRKRQQFYGFAVNRESARDVYSKRRIIVVTELKIVEWHSYKHLDLLT